jgi:hypothetical protein
VKPDWLPIPFAEAAGARRLKQVLPMDLSAEEYVQLSEELRRRAVFAAKVERADILQKLNELITRRLEGATPESAAAAAAGEAPMVLDFAGARLELAKFLKGISYEPEPGTEGTIADLRTERRQNAMLETNEQVTAGWAQREAAQDPALLDVWPAWELVRMVRPRFKERNWRERWKVAGGRFHGSERMIALKDDAVWKRLGDPKLFKDGLGNDFPPFAWGSGMRVRGVRRDECERLGVMRKGAPAPAAQARAELNEGLQAQAEGFDAALRAELARDPELQLDGDTLRLRG